MSDVALTTAHDIDLTNASPSFVEGRAAIAQHISISLRFFAGEWFLDTTQGIPYFGRILIKGINEADVLAIFRDDILAIPGVLAIVDLTLNLNDIARILTVTGKVSTIEGDIDFTEEI